MLPLAVKYNFAYIKPNIKHDHWFILKSNKAIYRTFLIDPIIIFCKNNSLKQLNGGNTIRNDKNIKKDAINIIENAHLVHLVNPSLLQKQFCYLFPRT